MTDFDMIVAWDLETFLMAPFQLAPPPVCASFAWQSEEGFEADLVTDHSEEELKESIKRVLQDPAIRSVGHNIAFDLCVVAAKWPDMIPVIFEALEGDRIVCTQIREKLLNLSKFGLPDNLPNPDGSYSRANYTLAGLAKRYLGVDRSDEKEGDDIWRLNYHKLSGKRPEDYPEEARDYALNDALDTLGVYLGQQKRAEEQGLSLETQEFQTACHFTLTLCSAWGIAINQEKKEAKKEEVEGYCSLERLSLLVTSGLVTPAKGPEPYANGARAHVEDCKRKKSAGQWLCDCPIKLKAPQDEKRNMKLIKEKVEQICAKLGIPVPLTEPSQKFPDGAIKTDKDTIERLAPHDPVLKQYQERQKWQKILSTEIPRMGDLGILFPTFDPIKETGRTSSYAGGKRGKGKNEQILWPSGNIQNVDPKVRGCYEPRPGHVLCSVDIKAMELVSAAQTCYRLFGHSVLRDRINAGIDTHAYLGSQLAWCMDDEFQAECRAAGQNTAMEVYERFASKNDSDKKFYKHWRKFAKPVGLGYPGGLGPATFIDLAAGYDFLVDKDTAELLREIWLNTYPEFNEYFEYIKKSCKDPFNEDDEGKPYYTYTSPLGMVRRRATYCAAANGLALQTPGAEGAKLGFYLIQRECYDPTLNSCLLGCRSVAFIHDEALLEIPHDEYMHERAHRAAELLVQGLEIILPDMVVEAEPALMLEWDKNAETVFDHNNRLTIWQPETTKES